MRFLEIHIESVIDAVIFSRIDTWPIDIKWWRKQKLIYAYFLLLVFLLLYYFLHQNKL